jgi:hypothetical protein
VQLPSYRDDGDRVVSHKVGQRAPLMAELACAGRILLRAGEIFEESSMQDRPKHVLRALERSYGWLIVVGALACTSDPSKGDTDAAAVEREGGTASAADGGRDARMADPSSDAASAPPSTNDAAAPRTDAAIGALGSPAAQVAAKLGRDHFLIGLGNDLNNDHTKDGAYTLGVSLDLHYAYLVGLMGRGGWTDWNANGTFVNILTDSARDHGTVPMFTLYSMAARGEANAAVLTQDDYMRPYWDGAKLLFQRLGAFDGPAVVHFEPDWWAYAQQQSHSDPSSLPVHVTTLAPDCASLPNNMVGMGKCLVALARKYAPKTLIGFHASEWADPDPTKVGQFLAAIGGSEADLVFIDMLDRDAGCFEAHTDDACKRGGTTGWYWDEANQTSPNFKDHFRVASAMAKPVGKPIMWWQLPLGVPSNTPGGTSGHYRDNRVRYLFSHIEELIAAGGVGAAFGTGAGNQTDITTDEGQFRRAVTRYYQAPVRF